MYVPSYICVSSHRCYRLPGTDKESALSEGNEIAVHFDDSEDDDEDDENEDEDGDGDGDEEEEEGDDSSEGDVWRDAGDVMMR